MVYYMPESGVSDPGEGVKGEYLSQKHQTRELGSVGTKHQLRSGDWRTVCHVSVASQNRQLTTSSTAVNYVHRPPSEAGIFKVGPLTRAWLQQTELTI